jgi:hypothetical protein
MIATFRRRRRVEPAPQPSGVACSIRGCASVDAQSCSYRDRRGRSCTLACCRSHSTEVADDFYCRRHASTVRAVTAPIGHANGVPDLEDRAPSLINWIAHDIDGPVSALLATIARRGERVIIDGYVQRTRDIIRRARWERSWRLVDDTGLVLKVSIFIDEGDDALVHVRVGELIIAEGTPPWISGRQDAVGVSIDLAQRQRFYDALIEAIAEAVRDRSLFRRD